MKPVVALLILAGISLNKGYAQKFPLEVMAGHQQYWYQQVFSFPIGEGKWGVSHTSSLQVFYDTRKGSELMSQSYITYRITPGVKIGTGSFYANAPGFKPSVQVQLSHVGKSHTLLAVPRVDIYKQPTYDLMSMLEIKRACTPRIVFYARLQTMFNYKRTTHNRSYQSLRIGFGQHTWQAGLAFHADAYGKDKRYEQNFGLFVRKELF